MVDEVCGQGLQPVRVAKNGVHLQVGPFALLNCVVAGPLIRATGIVVLDLLQLTVVQQHLRGPAFIHDTHRDLIGHRFRHGVGVDHLAEHIQRRIDGRAREAHIGRIRQRVVQILGKPIGPLHPLFRDPHLLVQIHLGAVRLIRDTDHISAIRQQLRVLGKLVNGGQKDPTAFTPLQQPAQL